MDYFGLTYFTGLNNIMFAICSFCNHVCNLIVRGFDTNVCNFYPFQNFYRNPFVFVQHLDHMNLKCVSISVWYGPFLFFRQTQLLMCG
jgi:hypothetical protein